jgi:hypothetical protein
VDVELLLAALSLVTDCLHWDFTSFGGKIASAPSGAAPAAQGGNTVAVRARISPGKAWRALLADAPAYTLLSALTALYEPLRCLALCADGSRAQAVPAALRLCLAHVAACVGEATGEGDDLQRVGGFALTVLRFLSERILGRALWGDSEALGKALADPALAAAAAAGGVRLADRDALATAMDGEVTDVCQAMATVIRNFKAKTLLLASARASAAGGSGAGSDAMLRCLETASQCATGAIGRIFEAVRQVGAMSASVPPDRRASLVAQLEDYLEGRYDEATSSVDAALEVWTAVIAQSNALAEASLLRASSGSGAISAASSSEAEEDAALAAITPLLSAHAARIYEGLVNARVAMAGALVRGQVNDDSEFDDGSRFADHMETAAALARMGASAGTLSFLAQRIAATTEQLQRASVGPQAFSEQGELEAAGHSEELWWLVSYAGYALADEAAGEEPTVPLRLNALSKEHFHQQQHQQQQQVVPVLQRAMADPVVQLPYLVLQAMGAAMERTLANHIIGPATAGQAVLRSFPARTAVAAASPLLLSKMLWFAARWSRTYVLPDMSAYRSTSLSLTLTACYGAGGAVDGTDGLDSSAPRFFSPVTGLAVFGTAPTLVGGRGVLEYLLQCSVLCLLLLGPSEHEVGKQAFWTLRSLANREQGARALVASASFAALAEGAVVALSDPCMRRELDAGCLDAASLFAGQAGQACISGGLLAVLSQSLVTAAAAAGCNTAAAVAANTIPVFLYDIAGSWARLLPLLALLPVDLQSILLKALLSLAHLAGGESAPAAEDEDGVPVSTVVPVLAKSFVDRLAGTFAAALRATDSPQAAAAAASAGDTSVPKELDRLLVLHGALVSANHRLPESWHFSATIPALQACPGIIDLYMSPSLSAGGGVAMELARRAMSFVVEFLDVDLTSLSTNDALHVYKACTEVFQAYAKHHAVVFRSNSLRNNTKAADEENESYESLLSLLHILQAIIDKEDLDFSGVAASAAAAAAAASGSNLTDQSHEGQLIHAVTTAVTIGLQFLLPLLTAELLSYPKLASAFTAVLCQLCSNHPQQLAYLSPALFGSFFSSLRWAAEAADPSLSRQALGAIQAVAAHHAICRNKSFSGSPGLQPQLVHIPDCFQRLLVTIFSITVGPTQPHTDILQPAATAVLSIMAADPDGFQATVKSLLASQPNPELASRLAAEFDLLTSDVQVDSSKRARLLFMPKFETFVQRVRAFTSIR